MLPRSIGDQAYIGAEGIDYGFVESAQFLNFPVQQDAERERKTCLLEHSQRLSAPLLACFSKV